MSDFPDFYSPFVVKGWTGTEYKTIKVAVDGEMYILLSALFVEELTGLQCDEFGNLMLNVKAQDLAEVINRPKYGAAAASQGSKPSLGGLTVDLTTIAGKGIIYGGHVYLDGAVTHRHDYVQLIVDGAPLIPIIFDNQNIYNFTNPAVGSTFLTCFDDTNFRYANALSPGITFETSVLLRYYNNDMVDLPTIYYNLLYALI